MVEKTLDKKKKLHFRELLEDCLKYAAAYDKKISTSVFGFDSSALKKKYNGEYPFVARVMNKNTKEETTFTNYKALKENIKNYNVLSVKLNDDLFNEVYENNNKLPINDNNKQSIEKFMQYMNMNMNMDPSTPQKQQQKSPKQEEERKTVFESSQQQRSPKQSQQTEQMETPRGSVESEKEIEKQAILKVISENKDLVQRIPQLRESSKEYDRGNHDKSIEEFQDNIKFVLSVSQSNLTTQRLGQQLVDDIVRAASDISRSQIFQIPQTYSPISNFERQQNSDQAFDLADKPAVFIPYGSISLNNLAVLQELTNYYGARGPKAKETSFAKLNILLDGQFNEYNYPKGYIIEEMNKIAASNEYQSSDVRVSQAIKIIDLLQQPEFVPEDIHVSEESKHQNDNDDFTDQTAELVASPSMQMHKEINFENLSDNDSFNQFVREQAERYHLNEDQERIYLENSLDFIHIMENFDYIKNLKDIALNKEQLKKNKEAADRMRKELGWEEVHYGGPNPILEKQKQDLQDQEEGKETGPREPTIYDILNYVTKSAQFISNISGEIGSSLLSSYAKQESVYKNKIQKNEPNTFQVSQMGPFKIRQC